MPGPGSDAGLEAPGSSQSDEEGRVCMMAI